MKVINQFKCEVCGAVYAERARCAECEKQHKIPKSIHAAHHKPMGVCAKYPFAIEIEFEDGSIKKYELKS